MHLDNHFSGGDGWDTTLITVGLNTPTMNCAASAADKVSAANPNIRATVHSKGSSVPRCVPMALAVSVAPSLASSLTAAVLRSKTTHL